MSIISTENLGLAFGARDVFSGIAIEVPNDGRIGLVGPNGIEERPRSFAYWPASHPQIRDRSIWPEARASATSVRKLLRRSRGTTIACTTRCSRSSRPFVSWRTN